MNNNQRDRANTLQVGFNDLKIYGMGISENKNKFDGNNYNGNNFNNNYNTANNTGNTFTSIEKNNDKKKIKLNVDSPKFTAKINSNLNPNPNHNPNSNSKEKDNEIFTLNPLTNILNNNVININAKNLFNKFDEYDPSA